MILLKYVYNIYEVWPRKNKDSAKIIMVKKYHHDATTTTFN